MRFILTGGNASDARFAIPLLAGLAARHVIADKAYDGHAILDHIEGKGARPIIPQPTCMPPKRNFDPVIYKLRNRIERTIGKPKQLRRIATRYDRIPQNHLASLYLAALAFWCRMPIQPRSPSPMLPGLPWLRRWSL